MKNDFLKMLIELQKKGVHIYLTDLGYIEFLELLSDEGLDEDLKIVG